MARVYFHAYHDYLYDLELLTDAEAGRLFRILLEHSAGIEEEEPRGNERFLLTHMFATMDREKLAYENKCRQNAGAARSRWEEKRTEETAAACERMRTDAKEEDEDESEDEKDEDERKDEDVGIRYPAGARAEGSAATSVNGKDPVNGQPSGNGEFPPSAGACNGSGLQTAQVRGQTAPSRGQTAPSCGQMAPSRGQLTPSRGQTAANRGQTAPSCGQTAAGRERAAPEGKGTASQSAFGFGWSRPPLGGRPDAEENGARAPAGKPPDRLSLKGRDREELLKGYPPGTKLSSWPVPGTVVIPVDRRTDLKDAKGRELALLMDKFRRENGLYERS